jgi:hydrogenase expression/formation protein HypE
MSTSNDRISMGAGGGGQQQRRLVEEIAQRLSNPLLDRLEDGAVIACDAGAELVFTTDSFVVTPLEFPGGDIGSLAVHGTVNDLAVMGAQPRWLSAGLVIEEGLDRARLLCLIDSMAEAARAAGVQLVTGDSKVVERGRGDGLYINTAGIGLRSAGRDPGAHRIRDGQRLVVSGALGDHSIAVLLSREGLDFEADVQSDSAPLNGLVEAMYGTVGSDAICAMRDITRGGLAAVLNEYAAAAGCDLLIEESAIPLHRAVVTAARVLGFEPWVLANEGKLLAVVEADAADELVAAMRRHEFGREAAVIGSVGLEDDLDRLLPQRPRRPLVVFTSPGGGHRVVDMPLGELLPRIC